MKVRLETKEKQTQEHKVFENTYSKRNSKRKRKQLFKDNICFTKREARCLKLILKGKTIGDIVRITDLSRGTVRDHLKSVRRKTGCSNNSEVINFINAGKLTRRYKFISKKSIT